jgi:alkanesulfonate monooxygenase SsuD/methylene tetrahydromethanopterin reductase-like flavin-dependent oxidoreductase (luciferase family)
VLLEQLAATGTPEQVRAQLERWEGVADVVMVGLPPGVPWPTIEATLLAAAPQQRVSVTRLVGDGSRS